MNVRTVSAAHLDRALAASRSEAARKANVTRKLAREGRAHVASEGARKANASRVVLADLSPAKRDEFATILASLRRIERALDA